MTDAQRDTLGARIGRARRELALRLDRDVTQGDLAAMVGVSYGTVRRWELGEKGMSEKNLRAVAAALGVTPGWLRYGIGPKEAPAPAERPVPGDEIPTAPPAAFRPMPRSTPEERQRAAEEAARAKKRRRRGA